METAVFATEQLFCTENIAAKQHWKVLLLLRSRINFVPINFVTDLGLPLNIPYNTSHALRPIPAKSD